MVPEPDTLAFLQAARRRLMDAKNLECCLHTRYDTAWAAVVLAGAAYSDGFAITPVQAFAWLRRAGVIGPLLLEELKAWPARRYKVVDDPVTEAEVDSIVTSAMAMLGQ